jgi:hypothetical protein
MLADVKPGQAASGVWKAMEDKGVSMPIVGDMIKERQAEATLGLNRGALNEVLCPISQTLPDNIPLGRDALDHTSQALSQHYGHTLRSMVAVNDPPFAQDLAHIQTRAAGDLPQGQLEQLDRIHTRIWDDFLRATPPGRTIAIMPGDAMKDTDTFSGEESRGYARDAAHDNRKLAQYIEDTRDAFRAMIARSNPQQAPELQAANQAWARWVRVRDAAYGANNGVFSPAQFDQAVQRDARTRGQAVTGGGLLQPLADAGRAVLPPSVPNSGTTDRRNMTELGLALLGGHAAGVPLSALAAGVAGVGAYSAPGQAAARYLAAGSPQTRQMLAEILNRTPVTRGAVAYQNQPTGGQ